MERIRIIQGDITKLGVDAIVNAANIQLAGGSGVDGAIHRIAGSELLKECQTLNGCPTGEAKLTAGYRLPARHVIHTVGPVWQGGDNNEAELLASCYRSSLQLAKDKGLRQIAFPAISCGVYRFPIEQAAQIAINEVISFLAQDKSMERVILVCFEDEIKQALDAEFAKHKPDSGQWWKS